MNEPMQEKKIVEIASLKRIALFLEGLKLGRGGNIQPLGNYDLEQLWYVINYLQGDGNYACPEFEKYKQ